MHKALGKEQVVQILGVNMGDSPAIADDLSRVQQALKGQRAMDQGMAPTAKKGEAGFGKWGNERVQYGQDRLPTYGGQQRCTWIRFLLGTLG